MDTEYIDEVYCPELGGFCNGALGCFGCPYRDEKLEGMIIGVLT